MPIDEILSDLRTVLEAFEACPNDETFARIQHETFRIETTCEDMLPEEE